MDSDINQQILDELRKLRKANQLGMMIALGLSVALCAWIYSREADNPWRDVSLAMRQSDYQKALKVAEKLATEHPSDYYAHEYLGNIYLALGDAVHAEAEYSRAYGLLPSEDMQKKLDAVRKRLGNEAGKSTK